MRFPTIVTNLFVFVIENIVEVNVAVALARAATAAEARKAGA